MFTKVEENTLHVTDLAPGEWFTYGNCVDPLLRTDKGIVDIHGFTNYTITENVFRVKVEAKWWILSS